MTDWHLEILGRQQQRTLQELGPALRHIRACLVGGTALALHLGHASLGSFDATNAELLPAEV